MIDLKAIRVFLAVADALSFAGAARALRMTPASVTRIIAQLEQGMGQQLFVRTTRQVSLTSAGMQALARYAPLMAEWDRAGEELTRAARPDLGRLRINAPMSLGTRVLPGLMESFRLAYPRVDLEVHLTDTLVDIIEEACDLAIRVSGPPTDKSTIWRKVCQIPRLCVAAPSLFDRMARPETPENLPRDALMAYSATGAAETWVFSREGRRREVRTGRQMVSNSGDYLCAAAIAGGGMCVLPDFIVRPALQAGQLEQVLRGWTIEPLWLTLYYPPYAQLPPLVATFSDFFESYMKEQEGTIF